MACSENGPSKNNPLSPSPMEQIAIGSSANGVISSSSSEQGENPSSEDSSSSSEQGENPSSEDSSSSSEQGEDPSSEDSSSSSEQGEDPCSEDSSSSSELGNLSNSSSSLGIPSISYDCGVYDCITTVYLNPNIDYGEYLDERDNQVYRTVQIGEQIWMAQNLNYAADGSFCFRDSIGRCQIGGRLYTWDLAKKVCPNGWHLPDSVEYNELSSYVTDHKSVENSIKASLVSVRHSGKDNFGFSATLGSGYRNTFWKQYDEGAWSRGNTYIWTASESTSEKEPADTYAKIRYFSMTFPDAFAKRTWKKEDALSVRCIKD